MSSCCAPPRRSGRDPGAVRRRRPGLTNKSWKDLALRYDAGGRPYFDAAAIHPFSRRVANVVKIVELGRAEMRRAATRASR
jgi:hypothetical protein